MSNVELLTTAEVAAMLGVDVRTVARWVNAGRIAVEVQGPGLRGARLFSPIEVARFAAELARAERAS